MRANDLLLGLLMILIGAITIWASRDFPVPARQAYGAGTFPTIIGWMLVVLGALLALRGWKQRTAWFAWQGSISISRVWLSLAVVVVAVVGYVLLTPVLGFPIVSAVMLTLLIGWLTAGRWLLAVVVGLAATLVVWLVFAELLRVPLGLGILEQVVY